MESKTSVQESAVSVEARLVEAREVLGLLKEDVSGHLGFEPGYLDQLESGAKFPKDLELRRLARLYRRNVAWILCEEDDAPLSNELYESVENLTLTDKEKVLQFARFLASEAK
jgi:transcriptional regulator with XRE-family HTH domain